MHRHREKIINKIDIHVDMNANIYTYMGIHRLQTGYTYVYITNRGLDSTVVGCDFTDLIKEGGL